MSTTGQQLEQLVARIERQLLPSGFTVRTNVLKRDENGIQVAEFDVVISGTVDSPACSYLFECRDRPSKGPAPASWIEQLYGRKKRFRFDRVTAVSTTGFAKPAIAFARSSGILLRSVTRIDSLEKDLKIQRLFFKVHRAEITGPIQFKEQGSGQLRSTNQPVSVRPPSSKQFFPLEALVGQAEITKDREAASKPFPLSGLLKMQDIFDLLVRRPSHLESHGTSVYTFSYSKLLIALVEGEELSLRHLECPVAVRSDNLKSEFLLTDIYEEDGRFIGSETSFRLRYEDQQLQFRVLVVSKGELDELRITAPPKCPIVLQGVGVLTPRPGPA